jgi:hypothetical protein
MSEQQYPYGEARRDLEEASKSFSEHAVDITSIFNSPITQQYLKGVLENMQHSQKVVQDKVKPVVPIVLASFALSCALAYLSVAKAQDGLRALLLIMAILASCLGIASARALNRALRTAYDFHIAAVLHARMVFGAAQAHHHWTSQVERALRQIDTVYRFDSATEIRNKWVRRLGWPGRLIRLGAAEADYEAEEAKTWSSRVVEACKAQPGTVLEAYQRLLGWFVLAHAILVIGLVCVGLWWPLRDELLTALRLTPPGNRATSAAEAAGSLQSVSSNLSLLNGQVLTLKTNLQNILGP